MDAEREHHNVGFIAFRVGTMHQSNQVVPSFSPLTTRTAGDVILRDMSRVTYHSWSVPSGRPRWFEIVLQFLLQSPSPMKHSSFHRTNRNSHDSSGLLGRPPVKLAQLDCPPRSV